jgi:chaperone BCS1
MYTPDPSHPNLNLDLKEGALQRLALEFSSAIPDNTFTPAQLQGYLLNHRNSPGLAASEMGAWVADEDRKMEEAKAHAKKVAEWKAKRRQRKTMELLAKTMESADLGAAGKATAKAKTVVETEKGVEAKAEGPVVNGEKKVDNGLKDTSEMQGPVVNEESSRDSKEKESTETTDPVVNGEKNGDGMKNESTKPEGEQMNGDSSPDEAVIDTEEPAAEKII